jgi:hypothetical protein
MIDERKGDAMNRLSGGIRWHGVRPLAALALALAAGGGARAEVSTPLAAATARAMASTEAGATVGIEQRVRAELRAVMTELIESGAFGNSGVQDIHLDIDAPAQQVSNLGVLVDSARKDRDGVHVLAITPGGAAEQMGMRSGDVLVAVNGRSLADSDSAAALLRSTMEALPDGSALGFDVRRGNHVQSLSGTLASIHLPAMHLTIGDGEQLAAARGSTAAGGCGRINDFDVAPRQQGLHGAKIISIDGVTPGPQGSHSFRVTAGRHTVKVAELIDSRYLPFNDRLRNAGPSASHYKTIEVDVAPDTTSLIAAHLDEGQRANWKDGAYWSPVAWKQISESCR